MYYFAGAALNEECTGRSVPSLLVIVETSYRSKQEAVSSAQGGRCCASVCWQPAAHVNTLIQTGLHRKRSVVRESEKWDVSHHVFPLLVR